MDDYCITRPGIEPLCGWPWLLQTKDKVYPEQGIIVSYDGKRLFSFSLPSTETKAGAIRSAMKIAGGSRK